jgi:hypothetical protein
VSQRVKTFNVLSLCVTAKLSSGSARTGKQAARIDQLRLVSGCAALAFPADVGAARTRDGSDEHVSRQQPVTTCTALGWPIQPLRARAVQPLADVNSHEHHPSIGLLPRPVQCANRYSSLPLVDRVVVLRTPSTTLDGTRPTSGRVNRAEQP